MPRGAAVVYPKDAAQIVALADIFPGAQVVEAGVGSGALTCSLLRAVGPFGRVVVVRAARGVRRRRPPQRRAVLRRPGRADTPGLAAHRRRPRRGAPGLGRPRRPDHPRHARALGVPRRRRGRPVARRHRVRVRRHHDPAVAASSRRCGVHGGFTEPQAWESLVRDWHVEGLAVRPGHKMIGHTAFLVTARRMAPGREGADEEAASRARARTAPTTPARGRVRSTAALGHRRSVTNRSSGPIRGANGDPQPRPKRDQLPEMTTPVAGSAQVGSNDTGGGADVDIGWRFQRGGPHPRGAR